MLTSPQLQCERGSCLHYASPLPTRNCGPGASCIAVVRSALQRHEPQHSSLEERVKRRHQVSAKVVATPTHCIIMCCPSSPCAWSAYSPKKKIVNGYSRRATTAAAPQQIAGTWPRPPGTSSGQLHHPRPGEQPPYSLGTHVCTHT